MKRITLLLPVVVLAFNLDGSAQRLPKLAEPDDYRIIFAPNFDKDNFTGDETIQVRLLKPTSNVVLNSLEIDFQEAGVTSGGATQVAKVAFDKEKETATLSLEKPLPPGPATIHIRYTGILNDELRGFYLSKANGRKYAVTQFEATDARRAFPSFDEPAYKATFDISVVADKGDIAISNGKIVSDTPGPTNGKHTITFSTTPKMSSYLVALAVGDFEYVEGSADGIPIRVWATPGKKEMGNYALQVAQQCMHYFNNYFGIKYPFEKLDLIGLPDFGAGAMENTAAITFRDALLLMNEKNAPAWAYKEIGSVISHEMAHQWFGDLVTMEWWDDIWLNEGFATWMESKPLEAWKPDWHMELDDVLEAGNALNVDSLQNTRPIHQAAETPAQIQELFDGIAYDKTAAVLRMLESYLGPEAFRAGVNAYLKSHAYGNATETDFWTALAIASHKPVDKIMPTFVNQPGAPLVTIRTQLNADGTKVTLSQRRYHYDRSLLDSANQELWMIPVCLKEEQGTGATAQKCELLTNKEQSFGLPGRSAWVFANAGASGYYRAGYDSTGFHAISRNAEKEFTPAERIVLLRDVWAAVRAGQQPITDFLQLAEQLRSDHTSAVIQQLDHTFDYIGTYLVSDADRGQYQSWVRGLLNPTLAELGWQPSQDEDDNQKALRAYVIYTLGYTGRDPKVLSQAKDLATTTLSNPRVVDVSLVDTAFGLAALSNDTALYDQILEQVRQNEAPEQYYRYLYTLAHFTDPALLRRTLDYSLSPAVRSQDSLNLIARVMANPAGEKLAWEFVQAHWTQIEKVMGGYNTGGLVATTGSFCDAGMRDEVQHFFSQHPVPAAERSLRQAQERVNYCIDLKAQASPALASWLHRSETSSGAGQ
ncbi:MAG TPA: M1 family metallopeptidase [Terriglobales bacterium]|nr:M1 family metallopeptidase [Terriglobales bacterium]